MTGRWMKRGLQPAWGHCCHLSGGKAARMALPIHSFTHHWALAFCLVDCGWGCGPSGSGGRQ